MMTLISSIFAGAALLAAASCTDGGADAPGVSRRTFTAYHDEVVTRTALDEDCSVLWKGTDAISVFDSSGDRYTFDEVEVSSDGHVASFSGDIPASDGYVAAYPASEDLSVGTDGTVHAEILPVQTATEGTFADGANLAIAKSDAYGAFHFKNVGALLAVTVRNDDITSIRISASGSSLTGEASIDWNDGEPVASVTSGCSYVQLDGSFEAGKTYYAVVFPGTCSGLTIEYTDALGRTASFTNSTPLTLERNSNVLLADITIPDSKWSGLQDDQYYTRVTSSLSDWTGTYLIVAGDKAASGTVSSKWLGYISVSVADDRIERTDATKAVEVAVEKSGSGYTMKFADGGYLGSTSSNDGINVASSASSSEYVWDFSYSSSFVKIYLPSVGSRFLCFNGSGFRAYTSANGTQATLYRYSGSASADQMTVATGTPATSVTETSATIAGTFKNAASVPAAAGFRYGTSSTALTSEAVATVPSGTSGSFSCTLEGLLSGRTYYYQAYVTVAKTTYTGAVYSFTTSASSSSDGLSADYGWFELPAQKDKNRDGIDDDNSDLYYSHVFRSDASSVRNFSACYSKSMIHPVWVAAPMHSSYKGSSGRNESYKDDPNISCTQSARFTGYTRGHMLGSSDRTVSVATNKQVFYYSNIGAQLSSGFNTGGGAWNNLESLVDDQWCADTLYQVIGCVFETWTDRYGKTVTAKTASNSAGDQFQVPTAWYKVLLRTKKGTTGKRVDQCSADELQCAAFILGHYSNASHQPSAKDMYSVAEVEKLTGLTFFVNVPNAPKDNYSSSDWGL